MNENAYRITLPSAGSLPGGFFIVTVQRLGEQREFLLWEKSGKKIISARAMLVSNHEPGGNMIWSCFFRYR